MSTIPSPFRSKSWIFQVTALAVALGMLLALSLKTQRQALNEGLPVRLPALKAEFRAMKQENANLQKEAADYKQKYERLAVRQASGDSSASGLEDTLKEAKLQAGTVDAEGPGVIVTLHDSPKLNPSETNKDVIENYIVHDSDIRAITNELFASGAEAISVNGQRLIANSSIRCAGPVVLVNSVQIGPPYVIKAIGKADSLESPLKIQGGVADALFLLDMIEIKKESHIVVPAYMGSMRFSVAKPIDNSDKKR